MIIIESYMIKYDQKTIFILLNKQFDIENSSLY